MRNIFLFILVSIITGCSAGSGTLLNPEPQKVPIGPTSNSSNPGTLEAYKFASVYPTQLMTEKVSSKICIPETPEDQCISNKKNLESDFNFNLAQIESGYNVKAYVIQYNTPGVLNENRSVSGGVLVPDIAENQIKGIVLYYHETEVSKNGVPSCFTQSKADMSYCLNNNTEYGELLGGVLASQGYIVVMPDYIGQGYDSVVMHPYSFYAQVNAISGLNMLTATNTFLSKLNYQNTAKNLYLTGFSEGASYAIWASYILQNTSNNFLSNNNLVLKDTIGLSGAYDLINAQMEMEEDNVQLGDKYNISNVMTAATAKPVLIGYALSAYGFYDLNQEYTSLMQPGFLRCTTCLIDGKEYTIPDLFIITGNPNLNNTNINLYLNSAAALTGYLVNGNNSAKALIGSDLLDDANFLKMLKDNSVTGWISNTPVAYVYLSKDSVVTNLNSTSAYEATTSESKVAIVVDTEKYQFQDQVNNVLNPIDHTQSGVVQLIAALAQIRLHP